MHLFAGVGGGILADLILGHEPIVAVEWDKYACKILRERVADGWFPGMSVWEGDVRLFDPSEYAGRVDCIHAGFPCQDISVAGKQAGLGEGTRSGLYREVLRIAGVVRPRYIFLENVSAILSNGLGVVLGDLASMGYNCKWLCIKASDVGAPHGRDRWFALAERKGLPPHAEHNGDGRGEQQQEGIEGAAELAVTKHISDSPARGQCQDVKSESFGRRNDGSGSGSDVKRQITISGARQDSTMAHANSAQCEGNERSERVEQKHSNTSSGSWWKTEPLVGRVAHGVPDRVGKLKGLGNAQVPLQAAAAWRLLTIKSGLGGHPENVLRDSAAGNPVNLDR